MTTEAGIHSNGHSNGHTPKPDWDQIRLDYVQGRETEQGLEWPTLEGLAKEHGVAAPTVRSRAHREKWQNQRHDFHTAVTQRIREKALEQIAEKAAQLDVQAFSVARVMFIGAARQLNENIEGKRKLTVNEQEKLLKICDLAHKMGRRALGVGDKAIDTSD
jgi:hypothetical protein